MEYTRHHHYIAEISLKEDEKLQRFAWNQRHNQG